MTTTRGSSGGWFAGVVSALTTAVLLAVLGLAVALVAVPRALDGAALTVLTGSMVPTYDPGDVVVVRRVHDPVREVEVGDVISFQPFPDDPTLVTHRVVEIRATTDGPRWVTRGDANGADDEPLRAKQITAEVVYHVPYAGRLTLVLGQHRSGAVVVVAVALLVYGAVMVLRPQHARRAEHADAQRGGDLGAGEPEARVPTAAVPVGAPTGEDR